jgi:hypothetical protein
MISGCSEKKGFTEVAVLMLALGVGANTAMRSILGRPLLRKLAVRNADELVRANSVSSRLGSPKPSKQTYYVYPDKSPVFSSVLTFLGFAAFERRSVIGRSWPGANLSRRAILRRCSPARSWLAALWTSTRSLHWATNSAKPFNSPDDCGSKYSATTRAARWSGARKPNIGRLPRSA